MNEITNHAELTVEKRREGAYLRNRVLMNMAYWLFPVFIFIILAVISDVFHGPDLVFGAILFIPIWVLVCPKVVKPLTFLYVDVEEKMDISGGTLTLSKIYGKRKKVDYIAVKVADLEVINPYRDEYIQKANDYKADIRIEAVSSMKQEDVYYAWFTNSDGKKTIMFFEATDKALKVLKFLNSATVVVPVSR